MSHSTHTKKESSSDDLLADAKALSEKIAAAVGPAPALTKADFQRSTKLRNGGAALVQTIAALSDKVGLVVPSQPTATMVEKVNQAQALVALHQELVTATKHVADTIFKAQSASWQGATAHYSMLKRLSKIDGGLGKALQPVTQFFARRSKAVIEDAKAERGGAQKGSEKAKAYRASKKAEEAAILAQSANPATPSNGGGTAPTSQAGTNGAAHS